MFDLIKKNKWFFIPLIILWVVFVVLLFAYSKVELHLLLNSYHPKFLDAFFMYYTEVGGWLPFAIVGLLLFYKFGAALLVLVPQLLVALPIYIIKQMYDSPRPNAYFNQMQMEFPKVAGIDFHCTNSFPSGHTTAAFAMFLSLIFLVKNPVLKFLFFMLALMVGYSRVYLSQHFAADVFCGSIIGVVFAFAYVIFQTRMHRPWMDKSLLKLKG